MRYHVKKYLSDPLDLIAEKQVCLRKWQHLVDSWTQVRPFLHIEEDEWRGNNGRLCNWWDTMQLRWPTRYLHRRRMCC